ncbi:MAG: macro domain-containing protein [Thermomicrobiales bacterium]
MIGRDAPIHPTEGDALRFGRTLLAVSARPMLTQEVAALVVPANRSGAMGVGIAGSIRNAGGFDIEREAMARAPLALGTALATGSGALANAGIRAILHAVVSDALGAPVERPDVVRSATGATLELAESMRLRTIAMPSLGGSMASIGLDGASAFPLMIDEIVGYQRRFSSRIERIVFICRDDREARAVRGLLREVHSDWAGMRR